VTVTDRLGDEVSKVLPQLRIDELLDELQARLGSVRSSRDRVRQLLEAVVGIGSGLDLEQALARILQASMTLVDARYGALGVLGADHRLSRFITVGLSDDEITSIGPFPEGQGLLGELIRHPVPLRTEDLTAHPRSHGFPANHPPMHSFLGVPVRVRDEVFGNLYLTEKEGGAPFDADDEAVLTALAAAAGVAIDNARLYDEARRRQKWLEATSELTRSLLSGQNVDDVLAEFAQRVRTFAGADLALVAIPDGEDGELLIVAADGQGADHLRGTTVGIETTLLGAVYKSGEPALVDNVTQDERADRATPLSLGLGPAFIAPLGAGGQSRGAVSLTRRSGAPSFDPGLAALTADLVVQASVVLELAERRRDSELLSLYADRDRIGRDLHDLAIQRLFATSMSLQGAYKITQKPAVARRIAQAVADLDDTIKVIRSTIFALHSHELVDDAPPGVRAQVIEACEAAAETLGFPPTVRFTGPVDSAVDDQTAEHLAAVLREALSNVARHARASRTEVDVVANTKAVTLAIADDGHGIPPTGRRSGLEHMRERAEQLGGDFRAETAPTGGTVVEWTAPLTTDPRAQ
jgi:two-component system, NarL family, sensor histidine kinase DevS